MRRSIWNATLAVTLLPAGVVFASADSPPPGFSAFALPLSDAAAAATTLALASSCAPSASVLAGPGVAAVRYRPRGEYGRGSVVPTLSQLHLGFFDPTEDFSTGFDGGFRAGPLVDPHVQLGVAVDWWHKSESQTVTVGRSGGTTRQRELSRSSENLFPILAFVQVQGDEGMPVIPYVGLGAGYEVLFLSADDFLTGASFDATYGGFGWQMWGGVAMPLSGRTRVTGEVFYNGAEVDRDVEDVMTGDTFRELVKMDGVGMRFGLSWGF
ncbi:MAG: hypothetical protein HZC42_14195 [Candidatus Eisenbacteria bacterium]|nr:hypothetical protein [Candidatus Eisenbacteria bacterium]